MDELQIFAVVGFLLAAYSIVANDAIQTLGTFLSSNARRPWWVLWIFASTVILAVMAYGYFQYDGDIAFDRLDRIPYPETGVQWWHAAPALMLLVLTRFGIPVSTTFLVLTIFTLTGGAATEGVMESMLLKSLLGYVVAFGAGMAVYLIVARIFERWVARTADEPHAPYWFVLQWLSTAYLWWNWLVQDLANIFVFLPRTTEVQETVGADGATVMETVVSFDPMLIVFATIVMLGLHGFIFATRGGSIQRIVLSRTNTTDIRAATIVDFIYGTILLFFKEINDIPMSTTWVFLGLLAGRELAITFVANLRQKLDALGDVVTDLVRAGIGLAISVALAISLPWLATGSPPSIVARFLGG